MNERIPEQPGEELALAEADKHVQNDDRLLELVKLFEGFTQASSTFAQSYFALEKRIEMLSEQLEHQARTLERTEGFLSSVLAHVPVGILVVDMDGRISLFNDEAERLTGLASDEVVGHPYGDVLSSDVNNPTSAIFTLTNGSVIDQREKTIHNSKGIELPVRFSTSWIFGDDGQPIGVLEVFEDIRPLRDLQLRMQQNASLAALGEMAAQVAHELRNPLAGVQGFTQFLLEDLEPEHAARPIAERIVGGVKDIDQIASRLLEFTRPISPLISDVDLRGLLVQEIDLARAEAQNGDKNIEIELKLPAESVTVQCDGNLIKQVVLNLVKNSMIAIDESGIVTVELQWDMLRNKVRIHVIDNGSGISEENLTKIFSPFFTTRTKGTGLGLSVVKKIIDAHYGTIDVTSHPGKGTDFSIELPIVRGQ